MPAGGRTRTTLAVQAFASAGILQAGYWQIESSDAYDFGLIKQNFARAAAWSAIAPPARQTKSAECALTTNAVFAVM